MRCPHLAGRQLFEILYTESGLIDQVMCGLMLTILISSLFVGCNNAAMLKFPTTLLKMDLSTTVHQVTPSMRSDLRYNLLYTRQEVDAMDPAVAKFLVDKRLSRPKSGMPPEWRKPLHIGQSAAKFFQKDRNKVIILFSVIPVSLSLLNYFNTSIPLVPGAWRREAVAVQRDQSISAPEFSLNSLVNGGIRISDLMMVPMSYSYFIQSFLKNWKQNSYRVSKQQ